MKTIKHFKGFTLVEVMIATLIITSGVVGLVTLQSTILKSEQSTDLRQLAMQLGVAKMDDLGSFVDIQDVPAQFDYNEISNNAGGALPSGNISVQVSADSGEVHTFNRTWVVTNQYFVDTDADGTDDTWVTAVSADAPVPLPAFPTQKLVTINVSWNDIDGSTKQVNIDGSFAPIPASRSFQANNESINSKQQPIIDYTPGEAPDVISYDLGNGEKIETSKPLPEIRNNGNNTVVNFETVKYIERQDGNDKLEQEDFATLNCSCELAGVGQGKKPSMTVLVDGELTTELGELTTKMTGVPANHQQDPLCTSCCRDHHDTNDMISSETYFLSEDGDPHKHYSINQNGSFSLASSAGDDYEEICRFKRVDGLFEIYPDWELVDIIDFSDQHLFDLTALDSYISYSESLVINKIRGVNSPARPSGRDREVAPGGYQYVARGVYVDRMKTAHKSEVLAKIVANDDTWKAITPFYDVNLTLLANWSTTDATIARVTQEDIRSIVDPVNNYYGTYSRGRFEALKDGVVTLSASAYAGNAGIIGAEAISADTKTQVKTDDTIDITVNAKAAVEKFFGLIGDIECLITINAVTKACDTNNDKKATYVDLSVMTIVESPSQFDCLITVPKGKATPFYSCQDVSENWTGDIQFNLTVPQGTVIVTIQYPDDTLDNTGKLDMPVGLMATSTNDYNVIVNVIK